MLPVITNDTSLNVSNPFFPPFTNDVEDIEDYDPPKAVIGDYIEIGYLTLVFLFGFPINLLVFCRHTKTYRRQRQLGVDDTKAAFLLQKLNLNLANLVMVIFYCPTMVGWLVSYRWIGGDFLCRLCRFLWAFSFHLSSNLVAGIALDRLRNVWSIRSMTIKQNFTNLQRDCVKPAKKLIVGCWIVSLLCSLPQWYVFCTIELMPNWSQCTTIWHVRRFQIATESPFSERQFQQFLDETVYLTAHLVTVFWAPFLVIFAAYVVILIVLLSSNCSAQGTFTMANNSCNSSRGGQSYGISNYASPGEERRWSREEITVSVRPRATTETYELLPTGQAKRSTMSKLSQNFITKSASQKSLNHKNSNTASLGNLSAKSSLNTKSALMQSCPTLRSNLRPSQARANWRGQLRTQVFKRTLFVALAFCVLWLPYNVLSFVIFMDADLAHVLSDQANWLKGLILLNAVLNPFLYGYSGE